MSPTTARRLLGGLVVGPAGLLTTLVLTASPAAAHSVGGGALPAPSWLLAYGGVAALLITAVVLRASWPAARLARFHPPDDAEPAPPPPLAAGIVGIVLLGLVIVTALVGLDTQAANPAPWVAGVVFWVGLPLVCACCSATCSAGSTRSPRRSGWSIGGRRPSADAAPPPSWIPAAFLFSFAWYFLAYYRPGSPRALAAFLVVYSVVAVGSERCGGATAGSPRGEGFGGLSSAVGRLSPASGCAVRGPRGWPPSWSCGSAAPGFDAFANTAFWLDVLGSSQGWARTLLDTVGLVVGDGRGRPAPSSLVVRSRRAGPATRRLAAAPGDRPGTRWPPAGSSPTTSRCSSSRARTSSR